MPNPDVFFGILQGYGEASHAAAEREYKEEQDRRKAIAQYFLNESQNPNRLQASQQQMASNYLRVVQTPSHKKLDKDLQNIRIEDISKVQAPWQGGQTTRGITAENMPIPSTLPGAAPQPAQTGPLPGPGIPPPPVAPPSTSTAPASGTTIPPSSTFQAPVPSPPPGYTPTRSAFYSPEEQAQMRASAEEMLKGAEITGTYSAKIKAAKRLMDEWGVSKEEAEQIVGIRQPKPPSTTGQTFNIPGMMSEANIKQKYGLDYPPGMYAVREINGVPNISPVTPRTTGAPKFGIDQKTGQGVFYTTDQSGKVTKLPDLGIIPLESLPQELVRQYPQLVDDGTGNLVEHDMTAVSTRSRVGAPQPGASVPPPAPPPGTPVSGAEPSEDLINKVMNANKDRNGNPLFTRDQVVQILKDPSTGIAPPQPPPAPAAKGPSSTQGPVVGARSSALQSQRQAVQPVLQTAVQIFGSPDSKLKPLDTYADIADDPVKRKRVGAVMNILMDGLNKAGHEGGVGAAVAGLSFNPGSLWTALKNNTGITSYIAASEANALQNQIQKMTLHEREYISRILGAYGTITGLRSVTRSGAFRFNVELLERELPVIGPSDIVDSEGFRRKSGLIAEEVATALDQPTYNERVLPKALRSYYRQEANRLQGPAPGPNAPPSGLENLSTEELFKMLGR